MKNELNKILGFPIWIVCETVGWILLQVESGGKYRTIFKSKQKDKNEKS